MTEVSARQPDCYRASVVADHGITATVEQVRLAEHRLTHGARQLRSQGDQRTPPSWMPAPSSTSPC